VSSSSESKRGHFDAEGKINILLFLTFTGLSNIEDICCILSILGSKIFYFLVRTFISVGRLYCLSTVAERLYPKGV
jgi:hypothetical protein